MHELNQNGTMKTHKKSVIHCVHEISFDENYVEILEEGNIVSEWFSYLTQ